MREKIQPNYDGVVDIARNCDRAKLQIAQNNAISYDLDEIRCKFLEEIEDADKFDKIFVGGVIHGFEFGGLNKISALFSYARYVENSIYVDTGSGLVRKDHSNSIPFQVEEVKNLASQHRRMAKVEIDRLSAYICSLKGDKCKCGTDICDKKNKGQTFFTKTKGTILTRRNDLLKY